ncbi:MAG: hypothetical protein JKY92_07610 [Magnetovibrio sp.]|nr:hypothetical protein [Magnetovibrio sp.]
MHRQIVASILEGMDKDRAAYFNRVVDKLEKDPRTQKNPNYVFLLLKETMSLLPTYLKKSDLIDILFSFVATNRNKMKSIIFDKGYAYDQSLLKPVTNNFIVVVVAKTLEHYETGDIETGEQSRKKFTFPYRIEDLVDLDDEDEEAISEDLKKHPIYQGPERRKRI